jgi:hypothetical protein
MFDHQPSLLTIDVPYSGGIHITGTDRILENYGGEVCGGVLAVILAKSRDTAYAEIGDDLGATKL